MDRQHYTLLFSVQLTVDYEMLEIIHRIWSDVIEKFLMMVDTSF